MISPSVSTDFDPFDTRQYASLTALTMALRARYPLSDVAGHEHIAPGRKTDPGPFFDWTHFRKSLIQKEQGGNAPFALRFPFMVD